MDKAEILINQSDDQLREIWSGQGMSEQLAEIARDARAALKLAQSQRTA